MFRLAGDIDLLRLDPDAAARQAGRIPRPARIVADMMVDATHRNHGAMAEGNPARQGGQPGFNPAAAGLQEAHGLTQGGALRDNQGNAATLGIDLDQQASRSFAAAQHERCGAVANGDGVTGHLNRSWSRHLRTVSILSCNLHGPITVVSI